MKADLYGHQKRYESWKSEAVKKGYIEDGLTKENSNILIKHVFDMELGLNVSNKNKKGARGFHRLNAIRQKLSQIMRMLQERGIKDIRKMTKREAAEFFNDMSSGKILTRKGQKYRATADYCKSFKSLWHWYMKSSRGKIEDITNDLNSTQDDKPRWVYLDDKQVTKLIEKMKLTYKPLLSFLYDTGARVTETFSLVAGDITEEKGIVFVNIRDEVSKGGNCGRKIKLMLCGKDIRKYIQENKLKPEDKLFFQSPFLMNNYLQETAKKLFGDSPSDAGEKYSRLTMYDFRHNSACFWLPRYKTSSSLMYRFGWKSEKYIHYYSEFLGMKDTISKDDMYVDITKTELEKELASLREQFKRFAAGEIVYDQEDDEFIESKGLSRKKAKLRN